MGGRSVQRRGEVVPEPVTVNRIIAYQLFPWESNLGIDYWDGTAWQRVSYLSGVPEGRGGRLPSPF